MLDPAIAKIIYFPNKRMAFQPTLEDIPITFDQVEEIRIYTHHAARFFDGNGDPWTPSTKANWCKKIAQEFPNRPDWRVLASEIEKLKFKG